jgi:hypothetical protein
MKITITIETGNAAFEYPEVETGRILTELAGNVVCNGLLERKLYDINGNVVGRMKVTKAR